MMALLIPWWMYYYEVYLLFLGMIGGAVSLWSSQWSCADENVRWYVRVEFRINDL